MKFLPLIYCLCLVNFNLYAIGASSLPASDSTKMLVFTHQYRLAKKYLNVGETVKLRLNNQSHFNRGEIIAINDSTLSLQRGKTVRVFALSDIDLIQKTSIGNAIAIYFSTYSFTYGAAATAAGAIVFVDGADSRNRGWFRGERATGIIITLIGLGLLFVSTLPFWLRAKRFNLGKKIWRMEVKNTPIKRY
jgi:hypothetical protein